MNYYKIVKIDYADQMPFDRHGVHATGRIILVEITYDCLSCSPYAGKVTDWYEYEDDWTAQYSDEELIGKEW